MSIELNEKVISSLRVRAWIKMAQEEKRADNAKVRN